MDSDLAQLIPAEHRRQVAIVPMDFTRDHVEDPQNPGQLKEVHTVKWVKKGSNGTSQTVRVDSLRKRAEAASRQPPEQRMHNQDLLIWSVIEEPYKYWLRGQEAPVDGTPLDAWPGITKGQADKYKMLNLRSVEDVAGMTDADCNAFGMGAVDLKRRAQAFVDMRRTAAPAAEMAKLRDENEQLRTDMAEMRALLDKISAAQRNGESEPVKRGPGRPRKMMPTDDEDDVT